MNQQLKKAIEAGNLAAVIDALDCGAELDAPDIHGDPGFPLRLACFGGQTNIVAELLRRGANAEAPNAHGQGAPIRTAARCHHYDIVRLLIAHGASVPPDIVVPVADHNDRRLGRERRGRSMGPPSALRERRQQNERRTTSVGEVALPEALWSTYFQPTPAAPAAAAPDDLTASMILARSRD